jgi:hypothetical protein
MSTEAMKLALKWAEAHGEAVFSGGGMAAVSAMNEWAQGMRVAIEAAEKQEPVANLFQAAKDFYNATVAEPRLRLSSDDPEVRDAAKSAGERLRAAIKAARTSDETPKSP